MALASYTRTDIESERMKIAARGSLLTVLLFCALSACRSSALEITAAPLPTAIPNFSTALPGPVEVLVDGAVLRPGSYVLPPGSLVDDAVRVAGGPTSDADLERINLAAALHDGDYVHVPGYGEVIPTPTRYGLSDDGQVDINLADEALLETLPGIGPAIAGRIVEYRELNGPFATIEELQEVNGIGPATFERLKSLITVSAHPPQD
jgi:competence protein ComEA